MLLTSNFEQEILLNPARKCDSLKIITGFIDRDRLASHLIKLKDGIEEGKYPQNISVDIILGMTKSAGLTLKKHLDILKLLQNLSSVRHMPKINCYYICFGQEVHSKIYIWCKKDKPVQAYCGSLNYTMNAFFKRRESVADCNPQEALSYYNLLLRDCLNCKDPEVMGKLPNLKTFKAEFIAPEEYQEGYDEYNAKDPIDELKVSLLMADGSATGYGSGINWGIRQNGLKRNPDQAYIPYNKQDKKDGFFPDREKPTDKNCPIFKVITKEQGAFYMRMAQQGNKGLHSAESNAILGEWIRGILKVPSGELITKEMLEKYGKTYVTFRKYEDGVYLLDF